MEFIKNISLINFHLKLKNKRLGYGGSCCWWRASLIFIALIINSQIPHSGIWCCLEADRGILLVNFIFCHHFRLIFLYFFNSFWFDIERVFYFFIVGVISLLLIAFVVGVISAFLNTIIILVMYGGVLSVDEGPLFSPAVWMLSLLWLECPDDLGFLNLYSHFFFSIHVEGMILSLKM